MNKKNNTKPTTTTTKLSDEDARIAKRYSAQDEISHILLEPDMYLGDDMRPSTVDRWMPAADTDTDSSQFVRRPCTMVHGVIKLFDEALVNSRDQVVRMALAIQEWKAAKKRDAAPAPASCPFRAVTRIAVSVDMDSGTVVVENDGSGIEVVMHPVKQKWVPELVFTTLRAGENGDKSKDSTVGGKNGHGAKLALVWSTASSVETVDEVRQLRYHQRFGPNLTQIGAPEVTKVAKTVKPFTRVQFTPDYARAHMPLGARTPDFLGLIRKRVMDLAAVAGVQVFFNNELVPIANMAQYVARFPLARPPSVGGEEEEETEMNKKKKEDDAALDEDDLLLATIMGSGGGTPSAPIFDDDDAQSCGATSTAAASTVSGNKRKRGATATISATSLPKWIRSFRTKDGRWEVFVGYSPSGKREQVSFVNGVCTYQGGTHVAHIVDQIAARAIANIEKRTKMKLKPAAIANQLQVFVRADISRPKFNGQAKEMLKTAADQFGGTCDLPPKWIDELVIGLGLDAVATARGSELDAKQLQRDLAVNAGRTGSGSGGSNATLARKYVLAMQNIDKFHAAPAAGRFSGNAAERAKTELMLTEGDSAMSGVVSGLLPHQKQYIGIFPLMGKPANVMSHALKTLVAKTIVAETKGGKPDPLVLVMRILGLEPGMEFTDQASVVRQLHYAHLTLVADQDMDGVHIKSLLLLFLHSVSPSLARVPGFVRVFNTPIVVVHRGMGKKAESRSFLTQTAYEHWRGSTEAQERGWTSKFYKGLGSSTKTEWQNYMSNRCEFSFTYTGNASDEALGLAFDPKRADDRKQCLTAMAAAPAHELDLSRPAIPVEEFVADMLRTFSNYSNQRALPHVLDSFKPSTRKIWVAARKRNLTKPLKVAQYSGTVAELTEYHHGDASLQNAIIGMAQQIPGQNNIALLAACGQFGTRLENGADAASPRYIFTHISPIALTIFRPEDDCVLPGLPGSDGGVAEIEPAHFMPILPMALVNPASGLGTGWSSTMVAYHPAQLADYIRVHYLGAEATLSHLYTNRSGCADLVPFYQGFKGTIERTDSATRFLMRGKYSAAVVAAGEVVVAPQVLRVDISEVPVAYSYQVAKEYLIELQTQALENHQRLKDVAAGKTPQPSNRKTIRALGNWNVQVVSESIDDLACRFVVEVGGDSVSKLLVVGENGVTPLENLLRLTSWIDTSNMTLVEDPVDPVTGVYSEHAVVLPRVHTSPLTIMERHRDERLKLYARRIVVHLAALRQKQLREENLARFLEEVCQGDLVLQNKSRAAMAKMLADSRYATVGGDGGENDADEEAEATSATGGYDYLLNVRMHQISTENVAKQQRMAAATRSAADAYAQETPQTLWLKELSEFDGAYEAYLVALEQSQTAGAVVAVVNNKDAVGGGKSVAMKKRKAAAASSAGFIGQKKQK